MQLYNVYSFVFVSFTCFLKFISFTVFETLLNNIPCIDTPLLPIYCPLKDVSHLGYPGKVAKTVSNV